LCKIADELFRISSMTNSFQEYPRWVVLPLQQSNSLLEFSVGAFLSRMCSPCALTLNSMFAEYAFAFPHSRNRCLAKTSKTSHCLNTCDRYFLVPRR
jgi:hypothetical protein